MVFVIDFLPRNAIKSLQTGSCELIDRQFPIDDANLGTGSFGLYTFSVEVPVIQEL